MIFAVSCVIFFSLITADIKDIFMSFLNRLLSLYLILTLFVSPFSQDLTPALQDKFAPFSNLSPKTPIKELTPFQKETLKEVFVNTEMRSVLDAIMREVLDNLEGKFESDLAALSAATYRDLNDESGLESVNADNRVNGTPVSLIEQINSSIAYLLLREIRIRHHTKYNKMILQDKRMQEIESSLKEMMRVMPTQGVRFFYIKGIYILAYKEFILFLHAEEKNLPLSFEDVFNQGKVLFTNDRNSRENLTLVQLASTQEREKITAQWPIVAYPTEPTEEMRVTLSKQQEFLPYLEHTISRIHKDFVQLKEWLFPLAKDSSPDQEYFVQQLNLWIERLDQMDSRFKDYLYLQEVETVEIVGKISEGINLLTESRELVEEVLSQFYNVTGLFYVAKRSEVYSYFDPKKISKTGNEEEARKSIDAYLKLLDDLGIQTSAKLAKLKTLGDMEEIDLKEALKDVMRDYTYNGVDFEIKGVDGVKLVTKRFYLELLLSRLVEEVLSNLGVNGDEATHKGKKIEIRYQILDEKVQIEVIPILKFPSDRVKLPTVRNLKNSRRFTYKSLDLLDWKTIQDKIEADIHVLSDQARQLRLPLKLPIQELEAVNIQAARKLKRGNEATLPYSKFMFALRKYKQRKIKHFFSKPFIRELNFLNDISTMTLESLRVLGVSYPMASILARLSLDGNLDVLKKLTLREVADQTNLRLSEVVSLLGISPQRSSVDLKQFVIRTHSKSKKGSDILEELESLRVSDDSLVLLRLLTQDSAGNEVEQLVIDRLSRIKQYHQLLGKPSSFYKFLFNARRTFDSNRREIILDEIYLDPQTKGYGSDFYRNQMRGFVNSGFFLIIPNKGDVLYERANIREDTISFVTLQWMAEGKIDWGRLAFKEHWLQSFKSLLEELGIDIKEGVLKTKSFKENLKKTIQWSTSFERYLSVKYGNADLGNIDDRFVEFLKFRLLGYGRRKVFYEKLEKSLKELADFSAEISQEGLAILNNSELDFWMRIQDAQRVLVEGMRRSGLVLDYLPDFSPKSFDRIRAHQHITQLLHQHELGLSLIRPLDLKDADLRLSNTRRRWVIVAASSSNENHLDDHYVFDQMQEYLFTVGETHQPTLIEHLTNYDPEIKRYQHFWKRSWKRPERYLRLAKAFHKEWAHKKISTFSLVSSRLHIPTITSSFLQFAHTSLKPKRSRKEERPSFEEMANILEALFYHNPQLVGIILRSSTAEDFVQMKTIFSEMPNHIIAKILDLEIAPFPKSKDEIAEFWKRDRFLMLKFIEPNEIYDLAYFDRVKEVLKLVEPSTLALILQLSYESYRISSEAISEELGWFDSVFLAALRDMVETAHFRTAMSVLKNDLNTSKAYQWVSDYFDNEKEGTQQKLVVTSEWFVESYVMPRFIEDRLDRRMDSLLNKKYSPNIYGAFMRYFHGYQTMEVTQKLLGSDEKRKSASEILLEIFTLEPKIAQLIVRSTPDTHDGYLFNLLLGLPEKELIQILNEEISFVPQKEHLRFYALNRYVIYRVMENFFSKSDIRPTQLKRLIDGLTSHSIAALIQHMWLNRSNHRFNLGIKYVLTKLTGFLDAQRLEEVKKILKEHDQIDGSKVALWFSRKVLGEVYPDSFYEQVIGENQWVLENTYSLREKIKIFLSKSGSFLKQKSQVEEFSEVYFVFENLLSLFGSEDSLGEALEAYGRVKMEMYRLLNQIMEDYEEDDLTNSYRNIFVFSELENQFDDFFFQRFLQHGVDTLEGVTPGKAILEVKVLQNTPEYRSEFQSLKKKHLVITNSFPENDPKTKQPGAILLGIPSSVNGHAYELAKAWKIPAAFLSFSDQILDDLDGEIVVFDVVEGSGSLRLANEDEKAEFQRRLPRLDISVDAFSKLEIPNVALGEGEPLIMSWDEIRPTDQKRVGYKAVRLARVKQETLLPVPAFFSVTYQAYQLFLEENQLLPKIKNFLIGIDDLSDLELQERLGEIKKLIFRGKFSKEFIVELEEHLNNLSDEAFVRSSSNVEDLPNFSGAGTLESFPSSNQKEDILKNIQKVWASLWEEAFAIRKAHGVRGEEHLRASVSELVQDKLDPTYSGTIASHYRGDPDLIEISIDEGISRVVDDAYEGQTSPHIVFNTKTGQIQRPYEDRPKFWQHSELGLKELVDFVIEKLPMLETNAELRIKVVKSIVGEDEEELTELLTSFTNLDGDKMDASLFKRKLEEINQGQAEKLFIPLYQASAAIEKAFRLSPTLIEFAIQEGEVIPLQVKGHEGARRIAFDVMILNKYTWHARTTLNLRRVLQDYEGINFFEKNQIFLGYKNEEDQKMVSLPEQPEVSINKDILNFMLTKGDLFKPGDLMRVEVMGPDALQVAQIIRRFFMMLSMDYDLRGADEANVLTSEEHFFPSWEKVVQTFGSYEEEDDSEFPAVWKDIHPNGVGARNFDLSLESDRIHALRTGVLWEIYQAVFGHRFQSVPEEIESAI